MDKNAQNLDPQLKATYERVMGTNVTSSPAPQAASPNSGETKVVAKGKGGKLSPALVVAAAIMFFLIYSLVWLMIFKVDIPFLPKFF